MIALTQVCLCHAKERREELSYSVKEANVQLSLAKSRKYCRVSEVYLGKLEDERNIISLTNSFCGQRSRSEKLELVLPSDVFLMSSAAASSAVSSAKTKTSNQVFPMSFPARML